MDCCTTNNTNDSKTKLLSFRKSVRMLILVFEMICTNCTFFRILEQDICNIRTRVGIFFYCCELLHFGQPFEST